MKRYLSQLTYDDMADIEENPPLLKSFLKAQTPKGILEVMQRVKHRKTFHAHRPIKYQALCSRLGAPVWSKDVEKNSRQKDLKWLKVYNSVYDSPKFWTELWHEKRQEFKTVPTTITEGSVIIDIEHPLDLNETISTNGEGEVITTTDDDDTTNLFSFEEYFLRYIECYILEGSMYKILNDVGRTLLNDERVMSSLIQRGYVDSIYILILCGLMVDHQTCHDHLMDMVAEKKGFLETNPNLLVIKSFEYYEKHDPIDATTGTKSREGCAPVNDMQSMFYMAEHMRQLARVPILSTLNEPKTIICDMIKENFPLKFRLYVSAFIEAIHLYCFNRCLNDTDTVFIIKPKDTNSVGVHSAASMRDAYYVYDLKHNIIFNDVTLFFKYNVYNFREYTSDDRTGAHASLLMGENPNFFDLHDDMINSCIEKGFDSVTPETMAAIIHDPTRLKEMTDPQCRLSTSLAMKMRATIDMRRYQKILKGNSSSSSSSSGSNASSLDCIPCFIRNDNELLSKDIDRLNQSKTLLKSVPQSNTYLAMKKFKEVLRYILHLYINECQEDLNVIEPTFEVASQVGDYYTKKQFIGALYKNLSSYMGHLTTKTTDRDTSLRGQTGQQKLLKKILVEEMDDIVKFKAVKIDMQEYLEYNIDIHVLQSEGKSINNPLSMSSAASTRLTGNGSIGPFFQTQLNLSGIIQPTQVAPEPDADAEFINMDDDEEDEDGDGDTNEMMKNTKLIWMSNVHKDCLLFNTSYKLVVPPLYSL